MNSCEQIRDRIAFYLDNELHGDEQRAFEAHLQACLACRRLCEQERGLLKTIRDAAPLYQAPSPLRERVEALLDHSPAPHKAPTGLRRRVQQTLGQDGASAFRLTGSRRRLAIAVTLLVLLFAAVVYLTGRKKTVVHSHPSDFALMAASTHQRHLHEQLPFEVVSDSPERISGWFAGKVSFGFKLPNYQEMSGQEKLYKPEGARLVAFNNDYAAYAATR
jgi:anti-sigma factor RsiW